MPAYFLRNNIKWHDAISKMPSNHLCDSQVCCANFLFPLADNPTALAALLRPIFPNLAKMLPIEDGLYVAFEWIGNENYLGEKISKNRKRTRGANFTSADAAVLFQCTDERKQLVLIEWKYTESYSPTALHTAKSGADRRQIYAHLFEKEDCPLDKMVLQNFDHLFYEPFYQFMRQQFLAHELEKAREQDADLVSLLHISPARNTDFRRVTSSAFQTLGNTATSAWQKLVHTPGKFIAVHTEDLFGSFDVDKYLELTSWKTYITARYPWAFPGEHI